MKNPFRYLALAAIAISLCASTAVTLSAASFTWDQGGLAPTASNAAAGTWDTTSAYWSNGTVDSAWNNSTDDTAIFTGGTTYIVTVGSPVTVGSIAFNTTTGASVNITLQSSVITLAGGAATTILVTDVNALTTISSQLTGSSGLTKTGSGGLQLSSSSNNYTGNTTVNGGSLRIGVDNGLSTASALTMTSGTMEMQGHSQSVTALSGTSSSSTIRNRAAGTSTITITGSTATSYAGALTDDSTNINQILALKLNGTGGSQLSLTNTSGLTYHGSTTISGGALKLSAGANLVNTSTVIINGGTLTNAAGNDNLGVGMVSMSSGNITPGGIGTAGTFTLAANQNFTTTGGSLNFDIGTASDQIIGSGSGTFGLTSSTLAFTLGTGFAYTSTYQLFSGFISGSSSGLNITGYDTTNYLATLDNTGLISFASAIPEPSTYTALAGLTVLGLVALRRRARH